jgi:hypothetical protein
MMKLHTFAGTMAQGGCTVPDHLKGNQADCMAISMQAMQWGMNPFVVAQKTHLVGGTLGYEAQLVSAVIQSSSLLKGRFKFRYSDGWEEVQGKVKKAMVKRFKKGGGSFEVEENVPHWDISKERDLWVKVGATFSGEEEITWGEPLILSSATVRNSPLWVSDPRQQLTYLAIKKWSRIYAPEVILGVYTKDELEEKEVHEERDITPPKDDINEILKRKQEEKKMGVSATEGAEVIEEPQEAGLQAKTEKEIFDELITVMAAAKTDDDLIGVKEKVLERLTDKLKAKAVDALNKRTNQLKPASIAVTIERMNSIEEYAEIMEQINTLPPDDAKPLAAQLEQKANALED